jgi:hypothetical protein
MRWPADASWSAGQYAESGDAAGPDWISMSVFSHAPVPPTVGDVVTSLRLPRTQPRHGYADAGSSLSNKAPSSGFSDNAASRFCRADASKT